jgi:DNA polymerase-3 subunit epsilon
VCSSRSILGGSRLERDGNPEGELAGEVLVFTGALSIPRREAADAAAAAGCRVDGGVTKHTTMLVVGDQDIRKLNGHEKSSKHAKAELLIGKGQGIRILGESDFLRVIGSLELAGCHA